MSTSIQLCPLRFSTTFRCFGLACGYRQWLGANTNSAVMRTGRARAHTLMSTRILCLKLMKEILEFWICKISFYHLNFIDIFLFVKYKSF